MLKLCFEIYFIGRATELFIFVGNVSKALRLLRHMCTKRSRGKEIDFFNSKIS